MILNDKKKNITNKLLLRVVIIIVCIAAYIVNIKFDFTIKFIDVNFINGILASAFVWGLLELADFVLDLHSTYIRERNYFLSVFREGLYKLKDYIDKNSVWEEKGYRINIDYEQFNNYLHQLREKLVSTQRDFVVYSLTTEIRDVLGYIERLYSFIHGVTYESIYKKQTLSDDDTKLLFEKIVCKYSEKQDMLQFDSEKQEFEQKVKNEIDIEVNFKEYKEFLSDDFKHCKGNLASKYFMIPEQEWMNVDFKPINDLNEYENKHKAIGIMGMLYHIIIFNQS